MTSIKIILSFHQLIFRTKLTKNEMKSTQILNTKFELRSRSYKTFFSSFFFFGIELGHFTTNKFFSVCNKNASLPAKN